MAKGYGADSTLVAAAYRLGQSYGPADYTKIFEYQYEGLARSMYAKSKMFGDIATSVAGTIGDVAETAIKYKEGRDKQEDALLNNPSFDHLKEGKEFDSNINNMATNFTDGEINSQKKYYEGNSQLQENKGIFEASQREFEALKAQIEQHSDKLFLTKKEREERNDAIKKTLAFRDTINNNRALYKATYEKHRLGFIDKELSHENNPDAHFLYGQVMKVDSNLADVGVRTFYKDGEVYFKYPVGMANPILKNIKDKAKELENISLNLETPTSGELAEKGSDMLTGKKEIGLDTPKIEDPKLPEFKPKEYKVISQKDLFGGLVEVDNTTRTSLEAETANIIKLAQEKIGGGDGKGKIAAIEDYSKLSKKTEGNIKSHLLASSSYRNLTNKPILIAGEEVNWGEDLSENIEIDMAVINQDFIGSNILTLEQLNNWDGSDGSDPDGKLSQIELDKHQEAKKMLIDKLLNPTTQEEKETSVNEFSKYINGYMEQAFDQTRERMDLASENVKKTPPPGGGDGDIWGRNSKSRANQVEIAMKNFNLDYLGGVKLKDGDKYSIDNHPTKEGVFAVIRNYDGIIMKTLDPNNPIEARNALYTYADVQQKHRVYPERDAKQEEQRKSILEKGKPKKYRLPTDEEFESSSIGTTFDSPSFMMSSDKIQDFQPFLDQTPNTERTDLGRNKLMLRHKDTGDEIILQFGVYGYDQQQQMKKFQKWKERNFK